MKNSILRIAGIWCVSIGILGNITASTVESDAELFVPEICDNGIDDDGDGLTDCADPDCEMFTNCLDAFPCAPGLYQTVSGALRFIDPATGNLVQVGSGPFLNANAAGYNPCDGYIYALEPNGSNIYRYDQNGQTVYGTIPGLTFSSAFRGDFGPDCLLYVTVNLGGTNTLVAVDLATLTYTPITTTGPLPAGGDFAFSPVNNGFYAITSNGTTTTLYEMTYGGFAGSTKSITPAITAGTYGATWFTNTGLMYAANNLTGEIFEIDIVACTATFKLLGSSAGSNDGASCPFASFPEICGNLLDDDGDGLIDCQDPDCIFSYTCPLPNCDSLFTDLGPTRNACPGDSVLLKIGSYPDNLMVIWSDSTTGIDSIFVTTSGLYGVALVDTSLNIIICIDSVSVLFPQALSAYNLPDTVIICDGDSTQIGINLGPGFTYFWDNGSTTPIITVNDEDVFIVTVSDGTCTIMDTIEIVLVPFPEIDFVLEDDLCLNDSILLNVGIDLSSATYLWSTGSTDSMIYVSTPGIYSVSVSNGFCFVSDTFIIDVKGFIDFGEDQSACQGDTIILNAGQGEFANFLWQDGSTDSFFTVTTSGIYSVIIDIGDCTLNDTIKFDFTPLPPLNLPDSITFCAGDTVTLSVSPDSANVQWSTGSTDSIIQVTTSSLVWVTLSFEGCTISDTVEIISLPNPIVNLAPDPIFPCEGDSISLNAYNPGATYLWSNAQTDSAITVTQSGQYIVTVTLNGCIAIDSVSLIFGPLPSVDLGNDSTICQGDSVLLSAFFNSEDSVVTYSWNTGSSDSAIYVNTPGLYIVTVSIGRCNAIDTFELFTKPNPVVDLGPDTTLCDGQSYLLDATAAAGTTYLWNDGWW